MPANSVSQKFPQFGNKDRPCRIVLQNQVIIACEGLEACSGNILCQFLPGPASSQVGMAIGLQRAGLPGLLAAWTAFTLPSATLMVAFAFGAVWLTDAAGSG